MRKLKQLQQSDNAQALYWRNTWQMAHNAVMALAAVLPREVPMPEEVHDYIDYTEQTDEPQTTR